MKPSPWVVVTGLDGSGKSTLVFRIVVEHGAHHFRLPFHDFVHPALTLSGHGTPFGDVHTDRLVFAADARLTNYRIRRWRDEHPLVVSQRGWIDSFVFGAVQGQSYAEIDALLRSADLERPTAIITLIADPDVAFARLRTDPKKDKYETREFIEAQHRETLRLRQCIAEGDPALAAFAGIPETLIDTTALNFEGVYKRAARFLVDCEVI